MQNSNIISLSESQQKELPEFFFAVATEDKSVDYLRIMPFTANEQFVPYEQKGDNSFLKIDQNHGGSLKIKCSREDRKQLQKGDIVALKNVVAVHAGGKETNRLFLMSDESFGVQPVEGNQDLLDHYSSWRKGNPLTSKAKNEATKRKSTRKQKNNVATAKSPLDKIKAKFPVPTIEQDGWYVEEDVWNQLLLNTQLLNVNTLFVGPSGTGKTELIQYFAKTLGKRCYVKDMAGMVDVSAAFHGVNRINSKGSYFELAPFTRYIQENAFVVFDEINRPTSASTNPLFSVLDNRRKLDIPVATQGTPDEIKVHENCRFFATANVGLNFTGTKKIDQALRERFPSTIKLDYLPKEIEESLLVKKTGVEKQSASLLVSKAGSIRELHTNGALSKALSFRHTELASNYCAQGLSIIDALENVFLTAFDNEDDIHQVKSIIQAS